MFTTACTREKQWSQTSKCKSSTQQYDVTLGFVYVHCFPSSRLQHRMTLAWSQIYITIYGKLLWFSEVNFQALREGGQSCIFSGWILSLHYRELQISVYSIYSSYIFNQRCSRQRILRSGRIYTPFSHYLIHHILQIYADIYIYAYTLICRYKYCCFCMTRHFHKLFPFLLYHPLSFTTLPSHTIACVLSSFNRYIKTCHKVELCHVRIDLVPAGHWAQATENPLIYWYH